MKKSKLLSVLIMSAMLAMTACGNKEVQETFESETLIESETIIESDTETSDNMEVETDVVESDVEIKAETKEETKAETIKTASANTSTATTDKTTTTTNKNNNNSSNNSSSTGNTTNTNKNNNNSSNNSSSNSNTNNSSSNSSNNSNSNSNKVETETSAPTIHTHNWVAQYKTVHHDATGHYETVTIQESKPIYSSVQVCSVCGFESVTVYEMGHHVLDYCMGSYYSKDFIAGYTDPITESKWVQDKAAYDEQVLTGYKCSGCSATK